MYYSLKILYGYLTMNTHSWRCVRIIFALLQDTNGKPIHASLEIGLYNWHMTNVFTWSWGFFFFCC